MPTPRSVADIKANLLRPALTSHFEVQIPIPDKVKEVLAKSNFLKMDLIEQNRLNLLCSEVSLPGSSLATLEINNDYTGVTERHAHRRIYDDRMDFTFYVDAEKYLPISFFEFWMRYISGESYATDKVNRGVGSSSKNYFYRVRYPDNYVADQGLRVIKFERDYKTKLEYEFIRAYPISISSIPVSYDSSSLLKCTVSMTYIRYICKQTITEDPKEGQPDPQQQASINGYNFQSNPMFENPKFASGGVPDFVANSSANSVYSSESTGPQGTLAQIYQNI